MIADRQRDIFDIKVDERRIGCQSPTWRVRLKTIVIRVKPFLSPSLYILYLSLSFSLSLYLLILISSRLLFDCLLYHLHLLDPSVSYRPSPSPILPRPMT